MKNRKFMLTVCIPAYNEDRTINEIIQKLLSVDFSPYKVSLEIIVINDCSTDNTKLIADKLSKEYPHIIKVISNKKRLGKSQSLRKGMLLASDKSDYVVCQDADLEYNPKDLSDMLSYLVNHNYDVAYGNRFGLKNDVIYKRNYYGNMLLSLLSSVFTTPRIKVFIPDLEVCYKMIRTKIAKEIAVNLVSNSNFGIEPEITAKLSKYKVNNRHLKFAVLPTNYYPRSYEQGKKINTVRDGLRAFLEILKFNISK